MPRYAVLQNYGSGTFGPWEQGTQVELDEHEAAWVNHDSPGTLARVKPNQRLAMGQPVPASSLLDAPDGTDEATTEETAEPKAEAKGRTAQQQAATSGGGKGAMSTKDQPATSQPRGRGGRSRGGGG